MTKLKRIQWANMLSELAVKRGLVIEESMSSKSIAMIVKNDMVPNLRVAIIVTDEAGDFHLYNKALVVNSPSSYRRAAKAINDMPDNALV